MASNLESQGVMTMLRIARALGMAPFVFQRSLRLEWSHLALVVSAVAICIHPILFALMFFVNTNSTLHFGNDILSFTLPVASQFLGIVIPLWAIPHSALESTRKKWQELLRLLALVGNSLGSGTGTTSTMGRSVVFAVQFGLISFCIGEFIVLVLMKPEYVVHAFHGSLLYYIMCFWIHFFYVLACWVKHFFTTINEDILVLSRTVQQNDNSLVTENPKKNCSKLNTRRTEITNRLCAQCRNSNGITYQSNLQTKITDLRKLHLKLQEICGLIEEIFKPILFLSYAYLVVFITSRLYTIVLALRHTLEPAQAMVVASATVTKAAVGAAGAWAAGSTSGAAGAAGLAHGAGHVLLLATRGRPAAEREAALFLQQLDAQPVKFSAGGLFPLDLRFFVGLFGTILGYLVVMVQFSPEDVQRVCSRAAAVNCSFTRDYE